MHGSAARSLANQRDSREVRGVRVLIAPSRAGRVSIPSRAAFLVSGGPRVRATRADWREDFLRAIPPRGEDGVQEGGDLGEMGSLAKAYAIRGLRRCSVWGV